MWHFLSHYFSFSLTFSFIFFFGNACWMPSFISFQLLPISSFASLSWCVSIPSSVQSIIHFTSFGLSFFIPVFNLTSNGWWFDSVLVPILHCLTNSLPFSFAIVDLPPPPTYVYFLSHPYLYNL